MKEEQKEKTEKPKVTTDSVIKEILKEKKANLFATVSEYIEDKTKVGELQEIINAALESAYSLGEMSEAAITKGDEIIASMGNLFNSYLNPHNAKYKQLYDNQRIITAHAQAEIQVLQAQIQTLESDGNLFTNVIERMPSIFGASLTENAFAGRW